MGKEKGEGDNSTKKENDEQWEKEKKAFWEEPTAYTPESRKQVILFKVENNCIIYFDSRH